MFFSLKTESPGRLAFLGALATAVGLAAIVDKRSTTDEIAAIAREAGLGRGHRRVSPSGGEQVSGALLTV